MDIEEKAVRKRRRSLRNLRRTSAVMPLNLDTLEEKAEDNTSKEIQSDGNQIVFGSMWCETLEPVLKKRRRRSSLLIGLVPRANNPEVEENEENPDLCNQNSHLTKSFENQTVDDNAEYMINKTNLSGGRDTINTEFSCSLTHEVNNFNVNHSKHFEDKILDNYTAPETRTNKLIESVDILNENSLVNAESYVSCEKRSESKDEKLIEEGSTFKRLDEEKINDLHSLDESFTGVNIENDKYEEDNSPEKISFNASDLSNITPPSTCSLSNVSSFSMSPEYPGSSEKPCEVGNTKNIADKITVGNTEMKNKAENNVRLSYTDVNGKPLQKSPGTEQNMSDSSHSDKENSIVNESGMNITPKGDFTDNVSPGFMSMCKAFAGKVVNFVKTSPSFLAGGFLDNSITTSVCASPDLKGNYSQSFACNELNRHAAKSDINKSLEKLGSEINKEYTGFKDSENGADFKGDNSARDTFEDFNSPVKQCVYSKKSAIEKPLSAKKSLNQLRPDSAKKTRDRKLFFDTFNAVMDVLNKDKEKHSTYDDRNKRVEAVTSDSETISGDLDKASNETRKTSHGDVNSLDHKLDDISSTMNCENIDNHITQQEPSIQYETVKLKQNCAAENDVDTSEVSKMAVDEVTKDTSRNFNAFEVENKFNDTQTGIISERVKDSQDGLENILQTKTVTYFENIDQINLNSDLPIREKTLVKEKQKKKKRRALNIPIIENSETLESTENEKDIKNVNNVPVCEENSKELDTPAEKMSENLATVSENEDCILGTKRHTDVKTQEHTDIKLCNIENQLGMEKKNVKSLAKVRKSRRRSFGFQNYIENTVETSAIDSNSVLSVMKADRVSSREIDEVDGINVKHDVECHSDIENRVAALDLGHEDRTNTYDNNQIGIGNDMLLVDSQNFEKNESENIATVTNDNVEKKKRGRRRKSANLNEILKRVRPKKVILESEEEEINESRLGQKNTNESNNVSELTNEISQVQIIDAEKVTPEDNEITVKSLILPEDNKNYQEQSVAQKRKRRRSAEAASVRLQMINLDQSPSSTETVTTIKGKRGRRKSAESGNMKAYIDLSNEISFTETESSSPNFEESTVTKRGKKRKYKEDSLEDLEKIYKNKNYVKPEEKKPWHTIIESPINLSERFGKKRLQRHIDFEAPTQLKLRRRLQKAVKNGWDPKKRMKHELEDEFVKVKLENLWTVLDEDKEDNPESLQNKLRSIVETN